VQHDGARGRCLVARLFQATAKPDFRPDFHALFGSESTVKIWPLRTPSERSACYRLIGSARNCMGAMSHPGGLNRPARLLLAPTLQLRRKTVFVGEIQYYLG
jgi:hypothetical protein